MDVVFRVDASTQVGTGHLMRSLTLAGLLRSAQANISFLCRELPADLKVLVSSQYRVHTLPAAPFISEAGATRALSFKSCHPPPDPLLIDGDGFCHSSDALASA